MDELRNAYKILIGEYERKRPLWKTGLGGRILLKLILRN
jgi:hypothetical protein